MNFDKYEVVRRLINGETLDEIADSMTEVINDGKYAYENYVLANQVKDKKVEDMEEILDLIHDYLIEHYTDSNEEIDKIDKAFSEMHPEDVVDEFDSLYKSIEMFAENFKIVPTLMSLNDYKEAHANDKKKDRFVTISLKDADQALKNFLAHID